MCVCVCVCVSVCLCARARALGGGHARVGVRALGGLLRLIKVCVCARSNAEDTLFNAVFVLKLKVE